MTTSTERDPLLGSRHEDVGAFERRRLLRPEDVEPNGLVGPAETGNLDGAIDGGGGIGKRTQTTLPRVLTFDLVRGLLCIFMAIDHSFFFSGKEHPTEAWNIHPDLHRPYLDSYYHFGLRFVTHLCAPGFAMLMGLGCVYFVAARADGAKWSSGKLLRHVWMRGIIFIAVGWLFTLPFKFILGMAEWFMVDIIVALGFSFAVAGTVAIVLHKLGNASLLAHLATFAILLLACAGVTFTCYLAPADRSVTPPAWSRILYLTGQWSFMSSRFPPLAWLPHVLYGVAYGRVSRQVGRSADRQAALSLVLGIVMLAAFAGVRINGGFGNLTPVKPSWFRKGVKEFLWTSKYPPDVAYSLLFLGLNHLLIALFALLPFPFPLPGIFNTSAVLLDFGTSPFFFYFLHVNTFIIFGLVLAALGLTKSPADLPDGYTRAGIGNGPIYWLVFALLMLPIWRLCRWYAALKRSSHPDSFLRFF
ncbi:hypothetical protein PYCC9005_003104 [Savitreella phatthalungensis]